MDTLEINFIAPCLQSNKKILNLYVNQWVQSNRWLILLQNMILTVNFDRFHVVM